MYIYVQYCANVRDHYFVSNQMMMMGKCTLFSVKQPCSTYLCRSVLKFNITNKIFKHFILTFMTLFWDDGKMYLTENHIIILWHQIIILTIITKWPFDSNKRVVSHFCTVCICPVHCISIHPYPWIFSPILTPGFVKPLN